MGVRNPPKRLKYGICSVDDISKSLKEGNAKIPH